MMYQALLSNLLYYIRHDVHTALNTTHYTREALWRHGISGDIPIALLVLSKTEHVDRADSLIKAHQYWRIKGIKSVV